LSFPVLSQAETQDNVTDNVNPPETDSYNSTYKQFIYFDDYSLFAPSPFRLPDVLGAASSEDKFHINAMARFEYDTNINSSTASGDSEYFYVNAEYSLLKGKDYDVRVSYTSDQTITNSDSHFDQQSHVGSVTGMYRTDIFKLPVYLFATYSYGYSFLNNPDYSIISRMNPPFEEIFAAKDFTYEDDFKTQVVRPSIAVVENPNNMTVLQYSFIKEEQKDTELIFFASGETMTRFFDENLNASELGLVHYLSSTDGKYYLYGGFFYSWQTEAIENFMFPGSENLNSAKYVAGIKVTLPYELIMNVDYYQKNTRYEPTGEKVDREVVSARLSKEIAKNFVAFLEYYDRVDEAILGFAQENFNRSIYSAGLNYRF